MGIEFNDYTNPISAILSSPISAALRGVGSPCSPQAFPPNYVYPYSDCNKNICPSATSLCYKSSTQQQNSPPNPLPKCKWQRWAAGPRALFQEGTSSLRLLQILVFGLCLVECTVPSITCRPRSFYPTLVLPSQISISQCFFLVIVFLRVSGHDGPFSR
jgi:hypothetical protein